MLHERLALMKQPTQVGLLTHYVHTNTHTFTQKRSLITLYVFYTSKSEHVYVLNRRQTLCCSTFLLLNENTRFSFLYDVASHIFPVNLKYLHLKKNQSNSKHHPDFWENSYQKKDTLLVLMHLSKAFDVLNQNIRVENFHHKLKISLAYNKINQI